MRMPGFPEIAVIVLILLVVFGAARLPQVGSSLGRSMRAFKEAISGHDEPDGAGKRAKGKKVKSAATGDKQDASPAADEARVASATKDEE